MFKILLRKQASTGLESFDIDKALKKIPVKDLSIMTFKQLNEHVKTCADNSASNLAILKFVGLVLSALALEKLNEIFHFVQHLPNLPGG